MSLAFIALMVFVAMGVNNARAEISTLGAYPNSHDMTRPVGTYMGPPVDAPGGTNDTRAYSVSGITSCVDTHVGDAEGTISAAKGNALVNCIRQARVTPANVNASAIDALMKKIEALRKQIEALKASAQ